MVKVRFHLGDHPFAVADGALGEFTLFIQGALARQRFKRRDTRVGLFDAERAAGILGTHRPGRGWHGQGGEGRRAAALSDPVVALSTTGFPGYAQGRRLDSPCPAQIPPDAGAFPSSWRRARLRATWHYASAPSPSCHGSEIELSGISGSFANRFDRRAGLWCGRQTVHDAAASMTSVVGTPTNPAPRSATEPR